MMEIDTYYAPSDVIGKECKHVAYTVDAEKQNDLVLIKQVIHTKDGRHIPKIVLRENFKRPVYVTLPQYRNHKEKKEYEERNKCQEYMTTDVNMSRTLQMALGARFPDPKKSLRQVCKSNYVYWADLPVTSYIKEQHSHKYPDAKSINRICVYDTETNEIDGTKEPWVISFVLDDEIHCFVTKKYADRVGKDFEDRLVKKARELLSKVEFKEKNKKTGETETVVKDIISDYKIFTYIGATAGHCIQMMFEQIHPRMPDLLVAWNHDFDIKKIISTLEDENIDVGDVLSHPDVPKKYRNWYYKIDDPNRKTESKKLTKAPSQQWHVLYCMASFYCVDAMVLFRSLRVHEGQRPSYKLDYTLETEVGVNKMSIPGLPYYDNLTWHVEAQKKYPVEYAVYNIMDNLLIVLLDQKTNDLSSAISVLAGESMYDIFPSLPKRICVAFTFFLLHKYNLLIGCAGSAMRNDFDAEVIGTDGWIVTLTACMNAENGLRTIFKEFNSYYSAMRCQVADADLTQAYPSANNMLNQSRETTIIELLWISRVDEAVRRAAGINLTAGRVNAMEIATDLFKYPDKDTVLAAFLQRKAAE